MTQIEDSVLNVYSPHFVCSKYIHSA